MPWTTPKTWGTERLISSDMNTHIRDNLAWLKDKAYDDWLGAETVNASTSGWSSSTASVSITGDGGPLQFGVMSLVRYDGSGGHLDVGLDINGGITDVESWGYEDPTPWGGTFMLGTAIPAPSAGTVTLKMAVKVTTSGTGWMMIRHLWLRQL